MSDRKRILFVCQSNLVCSPLAAAIARELYGEANGLLFDSAGIFASKGGRRYERRIQAIARDRGIAFELQPIKPVTVNLLEDTKILFYLDEESHYQITQLAVQYKPIMYMLTEFSAKHRNQSIPDPTSGLISYQELFELLSTVVRDLESVLKTL